MNRVQAQRGMASAEYLALVGVVIVMFLGLLVMRPHTVSRRTPVDVIPPVVRLLGRPLDNLEPRPRAPAPAEPRRRPPRTPPRRTDRPVVLLPEWWR